MKKLMIFLILGLLVSPKMVAAASDSIDLNNYYYAHANAPGEYLLKDKNNNSVLKGDYAQNDADILQIAFRSNWEASGSNKVVVKLPDGRSYSVSSGETLAIPSPQPKSVTLTLVKTDYTESYVELSTFNVYDRSNGGVNLTYIFTGLRPPTSFGDLGAGKPTAAPTTAPTTAPTATPKPSTTPNATPTPGINPVNIQARVDPTGKKIIWNTPPGNTERVEVWRNGQKIATLSKAQMDIDLPEDPSGNWEVRAISTAGNIIGKTELILYGPGDGNPTPTPTIPPDGGDPGTNPGTEIPCTDACQNIKNALECPELDEYLGKMANAIGKVIPPPPNWHNVADIMRDTIVPSMGQEMVNRSPEIARIIADEFESRETPVQPPPNIPNFDPVVPRFSDSPNMINESLDSKVPNFSPDYSESKPFTIPDPLNIELSDKDKGYDHKEPDSKSPTYTQQEAQASPAPSYEQEKVGDWTYPHYVQQLTWDEDSKDYKVENIIVDQPDRTYDFKKPSGSAAPDYQTGNIPDANYNFQEDSQIPTYKGGGVR
ncbi:hypothetical protein KM868_11905 [Micrococcus luteus]|uniref:hypothetical protein n=1 Tax=Micrococcus luteus TaxID=1270 RepID=UPI001C2358E7|nr:hypothetical protein [Micrococcus luteus]MBU8764196.1 hypothetical protein [Micrococcus luteus]